VKKSKVDAIIRRVQAQARNAGYAQGMAAERELNTLLMTPTDGAAVLGTVPEYQYVKVVLRGHRSRAVSPFDLFEPREMVQHVATFRAVQRCWSTQGGPTACWFEWQLEGMR
jgi:hypothetical protein